MAELTRRRLLAGSLAATGGAALLHQTVPHAHPWEAEAASAQHQHAGHGGAGHADFRDGRTVDHAANGFDPHELLRDFDWGKTHRAWPAAACSASGSSTRSTRRSRSRPA